MALRALAQVTEITQRSKSGGVAGQGTARQGQAGQTHNKQSANSGTVPEPTPNRTVSGSGEQAPHRQDRGSRIVTVPI